MERDSGPARQGVQEPMLRVNVYATASVAAFLAAACGLLYSVSFVVVTRVSPSLGAGLSSAFLMLGGLLGTAALVGLYERLRREAGTYLVWVLGVGIAGAFAAVLHGGYDLANVLHPPGGTSSLPNAVDPRGLGTFGLAGVALLGFSLLMPGTSELRGLRNLGLVSGALLILVYLARLIILTPSNPVVLVPAALEGLIVNPLWYVWLGLVLRRAAAAQAGGGTARPSA
jgi:hypothetical protein